MSARVSAMTGVTVLLGPQRPSPDLRDAVAELGLDGARLAAVTAGWEERELEDDELSSHLGGRTVNLEVFRRVEEAYAADRELYEATLARHERVRALQGLYRVRLAPLLSAARGLFAPGRIVAEGYDPDEAVTTGAQRPADELLVPEQRSALEDVRRLDAEHAQRVAAELRRYEERVRPLERPAIRRHRDELARVLEGCAAVCIAGGHVGILLNRLRLLGLTELVGERPVVAWSAGAMALAERVVVFHDSPPQGAGDAEVLTPGLGRAPGVVPLPHAARRLQLDDPVRVRLLAGRLAPAAAIALDPGARLVLEGERWRARAGTRRLALDGEVRDAGELALAELRGAEVHA